MPSNVIAVASNKGGVGKTTLAIELAYQLGAPLIDLDHDAGSATGGWTDVGVQAPEMARRALLDGDGHLFGPGDYFWSGVGSAHELTNRSDNPVRWLETQAPQPPSRHQFRYFGDWERLASE